MSKPKTKPESLGPAFNRLWSASLASNLADGLFKTSALLLAATLTKDPVVISILAAVVMLPWLLFAIPIGGLVDRIDRRLLLATANAVRFLMAAFLAVTVALDVVTIPILYFVAFVIGAAEVLYDTTAQSMIPQILKTKHLERGNARLEIGAVTVGEFVGTPLSGILFTAAIALPFVLGSAGILVAAVLVLMIPGNFKKAIAVDENNQPTEPTKFWADVRFGIKYLYENKTLMKLVILTASVGMFSAATSSTVVLFLTEELAVEPVWFGFVFVVPAIGAILGSITAPKVSERFGRTTVMAYSMIAFCLAAVMTGFSPNVVFFALVGLFMSITVTWWNVLLMSTYHQIIPNELFGRIHGTRRTLVWGLMPIGSLLGGFIASFGLRMPYFIAGGVALLIAVLSVRFVISLGKLLDTESNLSKPL
jgi:MFS family permease